MNWVQNVTYDPSDRITSMQALSGVTRYQNPLYSQKNMTYNANGQTTSISWSGDNGYIPPSYTVPLGGITYSYAAQTNGQITQAVDSLSGETIAYQYDQLKRLTQASSTPNTGSSVSPWTQTCQYDGFRPYGRRNIPSTFQGVVTGPPGSQVWSNGRSTGSLCNGLTDAYEIAVGVVSGYIPDNVPGTLQFASGPVVPGHSPGVTESVVAAFGNFTFYQPIYPPATPRKPRLVP